MTIGKPVCGQFDISGLHDAEEFRLLRLRGESSKTRLLGMGR